MANDSNTLSILQNGAIGDGGPVKPTQNTGSEYDILNKDANKPSELLNIGNQQYFDPATYDDDLIDIYRPSDGVAFLNKQMANRQSAWAEAGNAFLRVLVDTPLEILGNLGAMADIEDWVGLDGETGNWLTDWAKAQQKEFNTYVAPIRRDNPGKPLDVGDSAWWFDNGSNLVTSALGFVAAGYGTGGVGAMAGLKGTKALGWLKGLAGSELKNPFAAEKAIGAVANSFLLNQAESIASASNIYDQVYKKKLGEYDEKASSGEAPNVSREDYAKQMASDAAAYTMNVNRLNIMLNMTSASMFTSPLLVQASRNPFMTAARGLSRSPLSREVIKLPTKMNTVGHISSEAVQEFVEEDINMIAENASLSRADGKSYSIIKDLFSKQGLENGLLGAFGGASQTAFTTAGREINRLGEKVDNAWMSKNDIQRQRYYKQQEQVERLDGVLSSNNLPEFTSVFNSAQNQIDLIDEINENTRDNPERANILANRLLEYQAMTAFKNGTTDALVNVYKGIQNMSYQEAKDKGLDVNDTTMNYRARASVAIDNIHQMEKMYYDATKYHNTDDVFLNRAKDFSMKKTWNGLQDESVGLKAKVYGKLENAYRSRQLDNQYFDQIEGGDLIARPIFVDIDQVLDGTIKNSDVQPGMNDDGRAKASKILKFLNEDKDYQELREVETMKEFYDRAIYENNAKHRKITDESYQNKLRKATEVNRVNKTKARKKEKVKVEAQQAKSNLNNSAESIKRQQPVQEERSESETQVQQAVVPVQSTKDDSVSAEDKNFINMLEEHFNKFPDSEKSQMVDTILANADGSQPSDKAVRKWAENKKEELSKSVVNPNMMNAVESVNELMDDISMSISSDETTLDSEHEKRKRTLYTMLRLLENAQKAGIPKDDFTQIVNFVVGIIGKDKMARIFNRFKDLYNAVANVRTNLTFEDLFFQKGEKEAVIRTSEMLAATPNVEFIYNEDDVNNTKRIIEEKLPKMIDRYVHAIDIGETSEIVYDYKKIVRTAITAAYLSRDYEKLLQSNSSDSFFLYRQNLNDELNKHMLDNTVLDYREMRVGDKISLAVDFDFNKEYNGKVNTYKTLRDRGRALNYSTKKASTELLDRLIEEENRLFSTVPDLIEIMKKLKANTQLNFSELLVLSENPVIYNRLKSIESEKGTAEKSLRTFYDNAFIPIVIKKNGKPILYLHDMDWITNENTAGTGADIANQRNELMAIRNMIYNLAVNGKEFDTVINYYGNAKLIKSDTIDSVSKRFEDSSLKMAIVKNNRLMVTSNTDATNNEAVSIRMPKELYEGWVYSLLPIATDNKNKTVLLPVPLQKRKLNEIEISSIVNAIKVWRSYDYRIAAEMQDKYQFNILTNEGLKQYIELFLYNYNDYTTDKGMKEASQGYNSITYLFNMNVNTGAIEFARGKGIYYNFMNRSIDSEQFDFYINKLKSHLENLYIKFDIKRLGMESYTVPYIDDNGVINAVTSSYTNHIKAGTLTNLLSYKLDNGNYTYTLQPIIQFSPTGKLDEVEAKIEEQPVQEKNLKVKGLDIDLGGLDLGSLDMSISVSDDISLVDHFSKKFKNLTTDTGEFSLFLTSLVNQSLTPLEIETEILKKYCN